ENKWGKETEWLVQVIIRNFLLLYVIISLFRYFIYHESILSIEPVVVGMSMMVAVFSVVISWLQSHLKVDRKEKRYRYIVLPVATSIVTYFLFPLCDMGF